MRGVRFLVMSICLGAMILGFSGVLVAQETVKITHWSFAEPVMTHFWETITRDFSVEYPGLKLKKVEMPHGLYWDQILVLMTAGPAPDVTGTVPIQVKQWAAMEAIEPLDPWMELDEIKRTFLPQQRTFCVGEDGKTYAVTQGARPLIMIYNEKLFAEAGIPEAPTFPPEFVAAAMKMTIPSKGQYGLVLKADEADYGDTYDCLANFPMGYGSDFAKDGVPTANDPNTILGVKLYVLLLRLAVSPKGMEEKIVRDMLIKGKIGMYIDGPWNFAQARTQNPEVYAVLNAAQTPFANKACTGGAHHFLSMPTLAENKPGGAKFLQFAMRPKYLELYAEGYGMIPGNPDFTPKSLLEGTRWFKQFVEGLKYAKAALPPGFETEASEYARIVVQHVVGDIVLRDKPIEETMDKCQAELMELKKEMEEM